MFVSAVIFSGGSFSSIYASVGTFGEPKGGFNQKGELICFTKPFSFVKDPLSEFGWLNMDDFVRLEKMQLIELTIRDSPSNEPSIQELENRARANVKRHLKFTLDSLKNMPLRTISDTERLHLRRWGWIHFDPFMFCEPNYVLFQEQW